MDLGGKAEAPGRSGGKLEGNWRKLEKAGGNWSRLEALWGFSAQRGVGMGGMVSIMENIIRFELSFVFSNCCQLIVVKDD